MNSSTSPPLVPVSFPEMLLAKCPPFVSAGSWIPNPILCAEFLYRILTAAHYARDFLLLNLTIISSAVSSPFFTFSTTVLNAKPSLGSESIKRLRSAIGARLSYCLSSSGDTSKAPASFAKISSEGNRLPSSTSERKGEEIPILFANPRKMKKSTRSIACHPAPPSPGLLYPLAFHPHPRATPKSSCADRRWTDRGRMEFVATALGVTVGFGVATGVGVAAGFSTGVAVVVVEAATVPAAPSW